MHQHHLPSSRRLSLQRGCPPEGDVPVTVNQREEIKPRGAGWLQGKTHIILLSRKEVVWDRASLGSPWPLQTDRMTSRAAQLHPAACHRVVPVTACSGPRIYFH